MAVYLFWTAAATLIGHLLKLQGSVATVHVQRRVREQYNKRKTASRAAFHVLCSYVDWAVLQTTGEKGIYHAAASLVVDDARVLAWLVEPFLESWADGSFPLKDILDRSSLFPSCLKSMHAQSHVASSSRLDILCHGLDEDLTRLKEEPSKRDPT